MKWLLQLFSKNAPSTRSQVLGALHDFGSLFADEILQNPEVGAVSADGYKNFAYERCAYYQQEIQKQKEAIEQLLASNDGTLSDKELQSMERFLEEVVVGAKMAAQEFYAILDKGDGESAEVKRGLNKQCYDLSVEKRKQFLQRITGCRDAL